MKHQYGYQNLTYQCQVCGHRRLVWNSRQGAVPQDIPCAQTACKGTATMAALDETPYLALPLSATNALVEPTIALATRLVNVLWPQARTKLLASFPDMSMTELQVEKDGFVAEYKANFAEAVLVTRDAYLKLQPPEKRVVAIAITAWVFECPHCGYSNLSLSDPSRLMAFDCAKCSTQFSANEVEQ